MIAVKACEMKGWERPINARKYHYYDEDGRSLCGKWFLMFGSNFDPEFGEAGPDDCKACRAKVEKLKDHT